MTTSFTFRLAVASALLVLLAIVGCERDVASLDPAQFPTDPNVFIDEFAPGTTFQAFGSSKVDALGIDLSVKHQGSRSLKVTVPNPNDPYGAYAGGAFTTSIGRNLTSYNALSFWAKASRSATLDLAGFGNNNTPTSQFVAQVTGLRLSTIWTKYIIPIPLAEKLVAEQGLFHFAEPPDSSGGYEIWFDDVQFESLGTIAHPRPTIISQTISGEIGDTAFITGTAVTFDVAGTPQTVQASPFYFTFASSNSAVATVDAKGLIRIVGLGSASITAKSGSVDATGTVAVSVVVGPSTPAPTPTVPSANVISLFSNAYTNVPVDTWSADWDNANVADVRIAGNDTKRYTSLVFAGIEFTSQTINATPMTHFHMDFWTPDSTAPPAAFRIKLVDFGTNGVFGGGDDAEHELTFNRTSTPPLATGAWVSFDIPLSRFTGLTTRGHLAQMIISGDPRTVYADNVYFYNSGTSPTEPTTPAPTPTYPASDVISLFSNPYTNVTVDTWSAVWDNANVADVRIAGNDTKKYTNLVFAGIEFTSQTINATPMTHFHMDFWTPDPTAPPAVFRIKLVDFGANGIFGGGDDVEHELTFNSTSTPPLATGAWVSFDIPLANFAGLTTRGHLAQLIISGNPSTVYLDNVLFRR